MLEFTLDPGKSPTADTVKRETSSGGVERTGELFAVRKDCTLKIVSDKGKLSVTAGRKTRGPLLRIAQLPGGQSFSRSSTGRPQRAIPQIPFLVRALLLQHRPSLALYLGGPIYSI